MGHWRHSRDAPPSFLRVWGRSIFRPVVDLGEESVERHGHPSDALHLVMKKARCKWIQELAPSLSLHINNSLRCGSALGPTADSQLLCASPGARPPGAKGFVVTRRRWVVERTFAWIMKCRRLVRDYEQLTAVAETLITIAAIATLVRRAA
jgi:hypothetical protein